ncbi:MAG: thiol:disulfide interchange protein, partial [Tannerella sp.]|nr:thiol:disulfide interchange protein [Tannerella sp.]
MNRVIFCLCLLLFTCINIEAQIYDPVKWTVDFVDSQSFDKEIIFKATIEKGWHLYDMNLPEGGPVSTSITFDLLKGAELVGVPTTTSTPVKQFDKQFEMELRWFTTSVSFVQKIHVTDVKKFVVDGELEYMACNDETCIPPKQVAFSFDKKNIKNIPEKTKTDTLIDEHSLTTDSISVDNTSVDNISGDDIQEIVNETVIAVAKSKPENIQKPEISKEALWTPVIDELKALGDETTSATDNSWLFIFIAGFLGGLLALLTPCVWPMIPMTVSFFLKRAKSRRKAIRDALLYGFSIIVIYLAMGLIITGLFGASALNDLSTNAIFNIAFFLLLIVFAISFFGAFELVLPSSWTTGMDAKADATTGALSIFFMAFTLTLVSFSCTGPIIGTLLVEAASDGTTIGPAIGMFGFALALAIPFALLAIFPNMLQNMPKSGGWLNSVKVVLGFLEIALALKFLSVADLAYGWRILDRETFIVLWIVIFSLLGFYLLGKLRFKHDSELSHISTPRLFLSIV